MILFDEVCPGLENLTQLEFEPEERKMLIEKARQVDRSGQTDIAGEIYLDGELLVGGGRLYEYPPTLIDLNKPREALEPIVVNKIRVLRIEKFIPN